MNKLTMFVLAAVAAATVAIGGLAAAQSASAATATTKLRPACFTIYVGMNRIPYTICFGP